MLILGSIQSGNHEHYNSALKYSAIPVVTGLLYLKLRWSLSSCDLLKWDLWRFNTTLPTMKLKFPEFPLLPTPRLALIRNLDVIWKAEVSTNCYSSLKAIIDRGGERQIRRCYQIPSGLCSLLGDRCRNSSGLPFGLILQWKWKWSHLVLSNFFVTPWTVAWQVPLSKRFSRQEYWRGLPFPSPGDFHDPGIEPGSPTLQADSLLSEAPGKPLKAAYWPPTLWDSLLSQLLSPACIFHLLTCCLE